MIQTTLPPALQPYAGQIADIDAHEMLPLQVWDREIGPCMQDIAEVFLANGITVNEEYNHPNVPGFVKDDRPIAADTIWKQKGAHAPGSADVRRRLEVMDLMGVKRQLMFPTAGLHGLTLMNAEPASGYFPTLTHNRAAYGKECAIAYNKWGMKVARVSDRVRPVLAAFGSDVAEFTDRAHELVDNGIRAIFLRPGVLPGGISPAHPDLDPFWRLMTDHKVAVCLHISVDGKTFPTETWGDAPAFHGFRFLGEFKSDPWSTANLHITAQNFLTTIVLGGVFDRHPNVRFGVIELGAVWVGPLCDLLDMWYGVSLGNPKGVGYRLPERPSYYIRRNVRVSPFFFEEIDRYIKTYDLGDVLCYASDYPHIEGGFDPVGSFYARIASLGQTQVEKFFVKNGTWLLPD